MKYNAKDHPVIPVVTIQDKDDVLPLADALIVGGIQVIEITLRTDAALDAIKMLADSGKEIVIGAGTIRTPEMYRKAVEAGAQFIVSPGLTDDLAAVSKEFDISFLPGAITSSEVMQAYDHGFRFLKFFPAELSGGIKMLNNFNALFPDIKFCPTGGVGENNFQDYLALPNVFCVGGSWLASGDAIAEKNWARVVEASTSCAL